MMNQFTFKPLKIEDLRQLHQWFQEAIVNHWYARGKHLTLNDIKEKYEPRILGKEDVPSFIVYLSNSPFGFIQYYLLTESLPDGIGGYENKLFRQHKAKDLVGIDLFIAEERGRNKGLGVELISQFIDKFLTGFKAVVVDPDVNNQQAIRCYEKADFTQTGFSEDSNHLIMIKSLSLAKG
ncbi:GNAT family N-acetyltransferase [Legionella jamestowniensis]|uniref:Aminoglycoside 6'-N-acetyltransferase n=1 Tax=Legionella jamestowniensis TaxID=455 RepID=A0A0W0UNB0_9GAMM|nr:GNAT family N-acetyltransferase [Legionella jamestowniensis]KTD09360.1 aminoglycoside 6'-N-acetyltransferase [Legionella jamestowniensis]SFL88107.1 aminoglycoside 6'-N-acetyltransferase [Legionella jamestowniensis DSM 19215]